MKQLGALEMTAAEILEQMAARHEYANRVSEAFSSDGSPVRKLSEAKRGNTGEPVVHDDVDKVFAATLMSEMERVKASVKRFSA